jgi:hypothetical protein
VYAIQIWFHGAWVTVASGFKTQDDADWATAQWKQMNRCFGDPFRVIEYADPSMAGIR